LASVSKKRNSKFFFQGWLDQTIIYRDPVLTMNLKSRVNDTDTDNLKKLIKKRDEVKRKMTLLKQDESIYENTFSPITKRLETISNQLQEKGIANNFKPKEEKQETFKQIIPVENKLTLSDRISKLQKRMDSIKDEKLI
jgi:hypothetical protein